MYVCSFLFHKQTVAVNVRREEAGKEHAEEGKNTNLFLYFPFLSLCYIFLTSISNMSDMNFRPASGSSVTQCDDLFLGNASVTFSCNLRRGAKDEDTLLP